MLRRPALLAMVTALALGGGIGVAATANAAPNPHSQHSQCVSAAAGKHLGWEKQANNERRNVGGTCPSGL
jgi:hypothetical protein